MTHPAKALFISHGGGPMPLLGDPGHAEMVSCLQDIAAAVPAPRAIVVVSAHWEAARPTITVGTSPELIYDYYGFPDAAYDISYPCPGDPALAAQVHAMLGDAGFDAELDAERGFDHGLFVPLKIMYPQANIPCVQLSLLNTLDPAEHLRMGQALQALSEQDVLLVGSGFSFHNMKAFFAADTDETRRLNHDFEAWLKNTCGDSGLSEDERADRLIHWVDAPGARYCHPREEHLLPLHVCAGAAQAPCAEWYDLQIIGKASSMALW